jgi:hypothetical protein
MTIGNELCDRAEASGLAGKDLLWRLDRSRIMRDLEGFLDADEQLRARHGVIPAGAEVAFGMGEEAQVLADLPDGQVAFRGRIDRIDRSLDGTRAVVIDYKSGAVLDEHKELSSDPVYRGRLLQLPVYALAAQQLLGAQEVEAYYWFATEQRDYRTLGVAMTPSTRDRFQQVLQVIAQGISRGLFPARPGPRDREEGFKNCHFCPFDRVCSRDREGHWRRKNASPLLTDYVALVEGTP